MERLLIATGNAGKVRELRDLMSALPVRVVTPSDVGLRLDVVEDGGTLEDNAVKKAAAHFEATGLVSVGDDTGLEVEALGGEPGVFTARFAGPDATDEENRARLLETLAGRSDRRARFRTVVALVDGVNTHVFTGICPGTIADRERGEGGFGYDRIFVPEGVHRTFAEMTDDEKNAISHRAIAIRGLIEHLTAGDTVEHGGGP